MLQFLIPVHLLDTKQLGDGLRGSRVSSHLKDNSVQVDRVFPISQEFSSLDATPKRLRT